MRSTKQQDAESYAVYLGVHDEFATWLRLCGIRRMGFKLKTQLALFPNTKIMHSWACFALTRVEGVVGAFRFVRGDRKTSAEVYVATTLEERPFVVADSDHHAFYLLAQGLKLSGEVRRWRDRMETKYPLCRFSASGFSFMCEQDVFDNAVLRCFTASGLFVGVFDVCAVDRSYAAVDCQEPETLVRTPASVAKGASER